jgi:hypothetical protein
MKQILLTTFSILFVAWLLPFLLAAQLKDIPFDTQPSLEFTEKIYGEKILSQPFIAVEDNLSTIAVTVKNPNLLNKKDLIMSLYNQQGELLRTAIINGWTIPDGNFTKFRFDPLRGSKNQQFLVTFSSPESLEGSAFEIYGKFDSGAPLKMTLNDRMENGIVSSVTFYKSQNILSTPLSIYQQWLSRFLKDSLFAGFYLLLVLSAGTVIFFPKKVS